MLLSLFFACSTTQSQYSGNDNAEQGAAQSEATPPAAAPQKKLPQITAHPGDYVVFVNSEKSDWVYERFNYGLVLDAKSPLAKTCSSEQTPIQHLGNSMAVGIRDGDIACIDPSSVSQINEPYGWFGHAGMANFGFAERDYDSKSGNRSWEYYMYEGDPIRGYKKIEYEGTIQDVETQNKSGGCRSEESVEITILPTKSDLPSSAHLGQQTKFMSERIEDTCGYD